MKNKIKTILQLILLLAVLFSLTGALRHEVHAVTCTWEGTSGTDWFNEANWSGCFDTGGNPKHPGTDDDVIIPAGKSNYPVFTVYKGAVVINTLTIAADAQITVDEQTEIIAFQMENYGTVKIEEVTGHNLRINAPLDNHGIVDIGSEASLILYHSGTHSGSFAGKQLSFTNSEEIQREHTFQTGSSINVTTLFVGDKITLTFNGGFNCTNNMYIRTDSIVDLSAAQITSLGNPVLQGGTLVTDSFNIPADQTLNGTGTLQTNLVNHGTVSPGTSPGIITVDGDYTQESTGTLSIELGGLTAGSEHDQLVITGSADLDGILEVNLIDPFTPGLNDTCTIMTYGSRTGRFEQLRLPDLSPGLEWQIEYGLEDLTLSIVDTSASISGTVIYIGEKGYNPITVGLFEDPGDLPVKSLEVNSTTGSYPYTFDNLISGTYYIGALMDLNGNHQPDPDEPFALYSVAGEPFAFEMDPGETIAGIDFTLSDPSFIFLPLILR